MNEMTFDEACAEIERLSGKIVRLEKDSATFERSTASRQSPLQKLVALIKAAAIPH